MRFLVIVLNFFLLIQTVSANEGTTQGLKALYDELQYSVTVEWDQKDTEFQKKIESRFKSGLEELKKQGLTNQEFIAFTASQFKDKKAQTDFTNLMQSLQVSALTEKEMNVMVNNVLRNQYQTGANWFGELPLAAKIGYIFMLTVISSALVYGMIYGSFNGISDGSGGQVCTEVYTCDTYYTEYGSYEACDYQCL